MRLTREEANALLADIRLNNDRLRKCEKHNFGNQEPQLNFNHKLKCKNCSGEMPQLDAVSYCRGYKAAGGDPFHIWKKVPL